MAQSLAAAQATVGPDRVAHSAHSSFLRPVEILQPVRYEVELARDGRSYSTRMVRGFQREELVLTSTVSFQTPEPGPRQHRAAPDVPAPDGLPSAAQALTGRDDDAAASAMASHMATAAKRLVSAANPA